MSMQASLPVLHSHLIDENSSGPVDIDIGRGERRSTYASKSMSCNCFGYQDLGRRQHRLLLCLAWGYDVDGTSVGPVRRASVGTAGTSARCLAGTSGPLLQGTARGLAHRRARSRSAEVGGRREGSFAPKVLAQSQVLGRQRGWFAPRRVVVLRQPYVGSPPPSYELSTPYGSL